MFQLKIVFQPPEIDHSPKENTSTDIIKHDLYISLIMFFTFFPSTADRAALIKTIHRDQPKHKTTIKNTICIESDERRG